MAGKQNALGNLALPDTILTWKNTADRFMSNQSRLPGITTRKHRSAWPQKGPALSVDRAEESTCGLSVELTPVLLVLVAGYKPVRTFIPTFKVR